MIVEVVIKKNFKSTTYTDVVRVRVEKDYVYLTFDNGERVGYKREDRFFFFVKENTRIPFARCWPEAVGEKDWRNAT